MTESAVATPESLEPGDVDTALVVVDRSLAATQRRRRAGRLVSYLVTVFFLITVNFFLPRAMPGDPIRAMVESRSVGTPATGTLATALRDEETTAEARRYYGLDRPLLAQYGHYLGALARGDLGVSMRYNAPVRTLLSERLQWSLLLGITAVVVGAGAGMVAGAHSAWRRGRGVDWGMLGVFLAIRNFPPFFLASLALFVFGVKLGWVPLGGATTAFADFGLARRVLDIAHHLLLPASVMALQIGAFNYLVMRASVVGELGSDYLVLGRAKGLSERVLKYRYAARNALLPMVSLSAMQLAFVLTVASTFVETAFSYPGVGRLIFDAVSARDYPVLQGCFLVVSLLVVSLNAVADSLQARLDPRTTA
jgi:peptide/nickel transport system permease protein